MLDLNRLSFQIRKLGFRMREVGGCKFVLEAFQAVDRRAGGAFVYASTLTSRFGFRGGTLRLLQARASDGTWAGA